MNLREQFEAWYRKEYPYTYDEWDDDSKQYKEAMWQAYQAGHAVNAEIIDLLESILDESVVINDNGIHATVQIPSVGLDDITVAIKKARGEG
jgi:hypothetical protein